MHTTAVSFKMTAGTESLPKRHLALAFDAYSLWPRTITDVVPPKGPPSGKICLIAAMCFCVVSGAFVTVRDVRLILHVGRSRQTCFHG